MPATHLEFGVPDFIRLPRGGTRDPHSNLTRSALDLLIRPQQANDFRPPVESKLFGPPGGSQRPIRLINYRSLMAYLNSLPDGGNRNNITPRGAKKSP
jgi:hypothetical protein